MSLKSMLGFGMMRLPVRNNDPEDFDYEELNQVAEKYHADFTQDLGRQSLIAPDGTDVTDEVYVAYDWLREHTF